MFCYPIYQYSIQCEANSAFSLCSGRSLLNEPQKDITYKMILTANSNIYNFLSTYHVPDIGSSIINVLPHLILEITLKCGYIIVPILHRQRTESGFDLSLSDARTRFSPQAQVRITMTIQQCIQYYILLQILIYSNWLCCG